MFSKKLVAPLALVAASVLAFSGCAANEAAAPATTGGATASGLSGRLTGKGASSMSVAQTTWIAAFQTANPGVTVNYSPDGSGAGREAFMGGAAQFAGSDRALKDDEMGAGKFALCAPESNALNLPVYVSPIADHLQGRRRHRSQARRRHHRQDLRRQDHHLERPGHRRPQPGREPARTGHITAVHRSDDSGTTENFTDYLAQAAPSVWTEKAAGEWPYAFPRRGRQGHLRRRGAVTNGNGTIGYADASQAGELGQGSARTATSSSVPPPRLPPSRRQPPRSRRAAPPTTGPRSSTAPPRATRSCWSPTRIVCESTPTPPRRRW
jgi:phosphate transport system substrate-binding protein